MSEVSDEDVTEPIDRVRLNLRVDADVKEVFEKAIFDEYRGKRPYCGITLERECRFRLDDSTLNDLWNSVDDLAETFGQADGGKNKISQPSRGETEIVQYRVAEDVRNGIMDLAEQTHYDSAGEFVEAIMWSYANGRSREERLADRADRIRHAAEERNDAPDAVERRTRTIASVLENSGDGFDMAEFEAAIEEHATGISPSQYVKQKQLPRVLDRLGYTWVPAEDDVFVDSETLDTSGRDPRQKPKLLRDDADAREALKYAAYLETVTDTQRQRPALSIDDAVDILGSTKPTVRQKMKDLGENADGFHYIDRDTPRLAAGPKEMEPALLEQFRQITGAKATNSDPVEETDSPGEWVETVADDLADVPEHAALDVMTVRIAREKYAKSRDFDDEGDFIVEADDRLDELESKVTDDDREHVRERLGIGSDTTPDEEDLAAEAEAELDALDVANAAVATDGGRPADD